VSVLEAGSAVPEFELTTADGGTFTRDDLAGKTTVLVFYPAAFSGVCTNQFHILEEVLEDLAAQGARVLGVSCDQRESQTVFRDSVGGSIPMLSDFEPKGAATRAFGCYFAPTGVSNRALVIVSPELQIQWSWEGEHPGILPGANLIFDGLAAGAA
jgi:peroxiredoxin (alkyl hydroperoxide reductase subunit C)